MDSAVTVLTAHEQARAQRLARKALGKRRHGRRIARYPHPVTARPVRVAIPLKPIGKRISLADLRAVWGVTGKTVWDRKQAARSARS